MATIAGYKAVLIAADSLPRMFPMLMTAAGTIAPARVLVIGAGVAGLQAIATARRLGAVVSGYDIRAAVKRADREPGRAVRGARRRRGRAPKTRAATPRPWARIFTGGSARPWATCWREQNVVITTAAVPGQEGAGPDHARDGAAHGAGVGDRGYRGGARRQLRTDAAGRDRGGVRRGDPRAGQSAVDDSVSRQPDVCQQHRDVPEVPDQGRQARARSRRTKSCAKRW